MRFRCSKGLRVDEYLMASAKSGDLDVGVAGSLIPNHNHNPNPNPNPNLDVGVAGIDADS